ncbi:MAG: hypothetical protein JG782_167 [Anaerophaga sp.]|jgi:hypothetical protein|nr:hypothetical protein [Anaerophaga sp.]
MQVKIQLVALIEKELSLKNKPLVFSKTVNTRGEFILVSIFGKKERQGTNLFFPGKS